MGNIVRMKFLAEKFKMNPEKDVSLNEHSRDTVVL